MEGSDLTQMFALLRYHYRDPDIHERPQKQVLQLFAELQWVREQEARINPTIGHAS